MHSDGPDFCHLKVCSWWSDRAISVRLHLDSGGNSFCFLEKDFFSNANFLSCLGHQSIQGYNSPRNFHQLDLQTQWHWWHTWDLNHIYIHSEWKNIVLPGPQIPIDGGAGSVSDIVEVEGKDAGLVRVGSIHGVAILSGWFGVCKREVGWKEERDNLIKCDYETMNSVLEQINVFLKFRNISWEETSKMKLPQDRISSLPGAKQKRLSPFLERRQTHQSTIFNQQLLILPFDKHTN